MVTHFYEPAQGHRLAHDPLKAIIAPRPIGWISTVDASDRVNLAPYSFFNAVCDNPPIVMFSGDSGKDTIANAQATGEFVFNMVTRDFADAMNTTSAAIPHAMNEMQIAGLEAAPSTTVRPPRVAGVAAAIECKVICVYSLKDLNGHLLERLVVMGQATGIHINPNFIRNGIFDTAGARPIARCGYRGDYAEITQLFEMTRPSEAQMKAMLELGRSS